MPFDRTDPADLLALQTEVNTDPIGIGYAAVLNSTPQLLSLLNDPSNNLGGETTSVTFTVEILLDVLDPADYVSQQVGDGGRAFTDMLVQYGSATSNSLEPWRIKWRGLFQASDQTVIDLDALIRVLSRAEVLFGVGTVISREDWFAARDYTP